MNKTADESASILDINEFELDKECIRLPSQYGQAAWQAGETLRDIGEAKADLEVLEAEIHLKVRQNPGAYGITEKLTEGSIKEVTAINPKIRDLSKKLRALEHKLEMENVLVKAIDKKRSALGNLVDLHCAGYHSTVKPSGEGKAVLKKISSDRVSRPIPWKGKKQDRED